MTNTPALLTPLPSHADVCRLTIEAPQGRADLAVPVTTTVSALLLALRRHMPGDEESDSWVLKRLGEESLPPDATPYSAGLRHGDVLYLLPAADPLPGIGFDDVADGVARTVAGGDDRWRPELTRIMLLVLACVSLCTLAVLLVTQGTGRTPTAAATALALVLGTVCVLNIHTPADPTARLVAGLGACGFGTLAGLTLGYTPRGLTAPPAQNVMYAAVYALIVASALLATARLPVAVPGSVAVTALLAGTAAALEHLAGLSAADSVATVAVTALLLGHWAPRFSLRAALLRVPLLPHNTDELQEDIDPEPEERIARRVAIAEALLDITAVSTGVLCTAAAVLLVVVPGWSGPVLALLTGAVLLLRAWPQTGVWQRVPTLLAGALTGLVVLSAGWFGVLGPFAVMALLLVAACLLLAATRRLPGARLLPVWGRLAELLEPLTTLALVPLLLQVLGVYAWARMLAS
ncbi:MULTISPECIES: type VII secretion integral membrane protein EccD [unclassified Streptomyces]|uniref:type VII secretion integral membrane protein EccD n=1 Tax=unclassified Streptomyces TaxID=2593676 RepID=UPI00224F5A68|nr:MULTISPECIES: type VII secretion integral membrane protein EccD [unclassified Streptomyces]MCX4405999.1 type VII secretion integral membrane protein EccD [Streptomyces sp. NBC_01764]MCX5189477.1 type VII secretion integral membrane protein EccD [Streptomyces sp. NBC_00268]